MSPEMLETIIWEASKAYNKRNLNEACSKPEKRMQMEITNKGKGIRIDS